MAQFVEATILSIVSQRYPNLEYIVVDGGSTDGTLEIIKKYEKRLALWISERDDGMYHAIQKGFAHSTGEIMGWLNSDDILHPHALFVLARCFRAPEVNWVQGLNTVIDSNGYVVRTCKPFNTSRYAFLCHGHLTANGMREFGTLQQESTFWRRSLWVTSGGLDTSYKYAGDFALWMSFFRREQLYLVDSLIGAFRKRSGQLSGINGKRYIEETKQCVRREMSLLTPPERMRVKRFRFYESSRSAIIKRMGAFIDRAYRDNVRDGGRYLAIDEM